MMADLATAVLLLAGLPVVFALGVFCAELLIGIWPAHRSPPQEAVGEIRTVILMPAHNEAKVIERSVRLVLARCPAGTSLLVIADNCTDQTAAIARAAGADVTERQDPDRRGKGYALAHGLACLRSAPPDCVIVLDADAWPESGALHRLAVAAMARGRPAQGVFLIEPDKSLGPLTRVSNFSHMLKNLVRLRGVSRISGTSFLCGSGMAFPWAAVADVELANGEIVEDMVLGLRLVLSGRYPVFVEDARVWTASAGRDTETAGQRRRWEQGFLAAARRFAPGLLRAGIQTRRRAPLWLGLHLMVPPFLMLLAASVLLTGLAAVAGWAGLAPLWLTGLLASSVGAAAILVTVAWLCHGRSYLDGRDLLGLPRHLVIKLRIWRALAKAPGTTWNRTER